MSEFCDELRRTPWAKLERRLGSAIDRAARGGYFGADGFPGSASGAGSGGGGQATVTATDDETGEQVKVPVTGVEATMFSRERATRGQGEADDLRKDVLAALGHLGRAAREIKALMNVLDRIERRVGKAPDAEWCEVALAAGVHWPATHYGSVGGVLDRNMHLSDLVYEYVRRHASAAQAERLPTNQQIRHRDVKGTWIKRVDPTKAVGA